MIAKRIILPLITVLFSFQLIGQNAPDSTNNLSGYDKYRLPSITAGVGIMSFFGDIGTYDSEIWPVGKFNTGFQFGVEQRIGNYLGISLNGLVGTLAEIDNRPNRHYNFKTDVFNGNLNLVYHLDNDFILNKTTRLSPYISAGFGLMTFNPYADLRNKDGFRYYYWPDGSIRDCSFDPENPQLGNPIKRDYDFETKMDSLNANKKTAITLPISLGFNFKFSDKLEGNVFAVYNFTNTDNIDNYAYNNADQKLFNGYNDGYFFSGINIQYNISGKSGMYLRNRPYKGVDFTIVTKGDADGDKVEDREDRCPDTPQGVAVDNMGCPLDDDKDGVPNYLDKETNTAFGNIVDVNGVTMTPEMIAEKFMRDSLIMSGELVLDKDSTLSISEVDRSQIFAMSNAYLISLRMAEKKIEADSIRLANERLAARKKFMAGNVIEEEALAENVFEEISPEKIGEEEVVKEQVSEETPVENVVEEISDGKVVKEVSMEEIVKKFSTEKVVDNTAMKDYVNSTNATTAPGLVYRSQIASLSNSVSRPFFRKYFNITEEIYVDAYKGAYKYSVGKFATYAEARKYANDIRTKTGIKAFVIAFVDGQRISIPEAKVLSKE